MAVPELPQVTFFFTDNLGCTATAALGRSAAILLFSHKTHEVTMRRLKPLNHITTAGLFDNNGTVEELRKSQEKVGVGNLALLKV